MNNFFAANDANLSSFNFYENRWCNKLWPVILYYFHWGVGVGCSPSPKTWLTLTLRGQSWRVISNRGETEHCGHKSPGYHLLTYTSQVDGVFCAIWLVPLSEYPALITRAKQDGIRLCLISYHMLMTEKAAFGKTLDIIRKCIKYPFISHELKTQYAVMVTIN